MSGAICGGIINETKFSNNSLAYMMCWILPDKQYEKYIALKKDKKEKQAKAIFEKYAYSAI